MKFMNLLKSKDDTIDFCNILSPCGIKTLEHSTIEKIMFIFLIGLSLCVVFGV